MLHFSNPRNRGKRYHDFELERSWGIKMKRAILVATLVSVSAGFGWVAYLAEPQRAMAIPLSTSPAAVIMSCSGNPIQTQTNYTVLTVDSSPNSPSISTGGSCAAAVALLVSQGFKNVKQVNDTTLIDLLVYTFIRGQEVALN
jgi:hypothetical protein